MIRAMENGDAERFDFCADLLEALRKNRADAFIEVLAYTIWQGDRYYDARPGTKKRNQRHRAGTIIEILSGKEGLAF